MAKQDIDMVSLEVFIWSMVSLGKDTRGAFSLESMSFVNAVKAKQGIDIVFPGGLHMEHGFPWNTPLSSPRMEYGVCSKVTL